MTLRRFYQLSFATETEFLGGFCTDAESFEAAYVKACLLDVNPGGEVAGFGFRAISVHPDYLDRLLNRRELDEMPMPEGATVEGVEDAPTLAAE